MGKTFRGSKGKCLSEFVEKYPEKKGFFELKNDVQKFVFPVPGPLEGIKSRTKNILKMQDVTFQYPTKDTPTIFDINLTVSQVSRFAGNDDRESLEFKGDEISASEEELRAVKWMIDP